LKLLVDMNLSPLWVEELGRAGIGAVHWSAVGDPRAPDERIFDWARERELVVFTHDLDFGRILALTGAAGPSVIQLRTHDLLPAKVGELVVDAVVAHRDLLDRGALLVIDAAAARVRILPIRRDSRE
jgi:predicted nuclease of predicted toxin-antitoxin system